MTHIKYLSPGCAYTSGTAWIIVGNGPHHITVILIISDKSGTVQKKYTHQNDSKYMNNKSIFIES